MASSPNIAGAISAIVVFDIKGRVILSRDYRGDVEMKVAERFLAKVNELEEAGRVSPVLYDNGVSYLYVQYSNLFVVALAKTNVNAASTLLFLHKLIEVFKHYFTELEEESLRDNFVIAYELLDEVCRHKVRQGVHFFFAWCVLDLHHIAATDDGLWVPAVYRSKDPLRVHQNRRIPHARLCAPAHGRDQRRLLALRGAVLQEERGVLGRGGVGQSPGQQQRQRRALRSGRRAQDADVPQRHA